jgi:hypothetical protein
LSTARNVHFDLENDDHNKTLIEGGGDGDDDEDGDDLSRLAERYATRRSPSASSSSRPAAIKPKALSDLESNEQPHLLSSSIDKILNSFFTSDEKMNSDDVATSSAADKASNKAHFQRTKSISMSEKGNESLSAQPSEAFSLDDLANEYLSNLKTTPQLAATVGSPTLADNLTSFGSSLADLIENEFNQRLSLSEINAMDVSAVAHDDPSNLINLDKENLLINRKSSKATANSSRNSDASAVAYRTVAAGASSASLSPVASNFQLIKNKFEFTNNLMFLVQLKSNLSDLLSRNKWITSPLVEDHRFDYARQIETRNSNVSRRKKIIVDFTNGTVRVERKAASAAAAGGGEGNSDIVVGGRKRKSTDTGAANAAVEPSANSSKAKKAGVSSKSSSSSSSKAGSSSLLSKVNNNNKKLKPFDFSIPSPDDIVIAKQKFAFKNIKFNK